ncbi:MAG: branched-chain amino acid ABC transporter permease [Desulfobacteraceae bacterium]|jgi:branched-chain amino acid transport system permease protein|nr:MAG: branched-chain amino acid ABC transporter permease [Desulfobacteraceae bacterium]
MDKRKNLIWFVLAIVIALFPFLGVNTFTVQLLTLAGIYATVALGLSFVLGNAGQISLGQAAFFGIGAFTTAQLITKFQISFWLALPAGGFLAGLAGAAPGYLALRFQGHYLAMVTLCFGLILQILFLELPSITGGAGGIPDIPSPFILGRAIDNSAGAIIKTFHVAWFLLLATAWLLNNLLSARSGRAFAAIRDDTLAAEATGIPVAGYKVRAFIIAAVLAGLSGGVYCIHTHYIGPEIFGVGSSLEFLIIVVIGGLGSPVGAVVGSLLFAVLPEVMRSYEEYRLLVFGCMLMLIVLIAPGGIWGLVSNRISKVWKNVKNRL